MMHKHLIKLTLICGLCMFVVLGIAYATSPDDSPPINKESNIVRKQDSLYVMWYGRGPGYVRSGRLGSAGNRSFRGGGLHGGK